MWRGYDSTPSRRFSNQKALSAFLREVESNSRRWESKAKEAGERAAHAEAERDAARHKVAMAQLETKTAGSARSRVEFELARV